MLSGVRTNLVNYGSTDSRDNVYEINHVTEEMLVLASYTNSLMLKIYGMDL